MKRGEKNGIVSDLTKCAESVQAGNGWLAQIDITWCLENACAEQYMNVNDARLY